MYKRILVPTDGSELSIEAVKGAARFAKPLGASVVLITVIEPYSYTSRIFATPLVKSFSPAEAIMEASTQYDCDCVFMASHGRKGLAAVLLGSETQKVLTHSKVPVMVYR